jgi:hypothetical protein
MRCALISTLPCAKEQGSMCRKHAMRCVKLQYWYYTSLHLTLYARHQGTLVPAGLGNSPAVP